MYLDAHFPFKRNFFFFLMFKGFFPNHVFKDIQDQWARINSMLYLLDFEVETTFCWNQVKNQ